MGWPGQSISWDLDENELWKDSNYGLDDNKPHTTYVTWPEHIYPLVFDIAMEHGPWLLKICEIKWWKKVRDQRRCPGTPLWFHPPEVVFLNCVTWPSSLLQAVARKALRLRPGAVVISGKRHWAEDVELGWAQMLIGGGSKPIIIISNGMNIHLPAILGFTRCQGFDQ